MTEDSVERPATKHIRFHERLLRLSDWIDGDPNIDEDLWLIPKQALVEINELRAENKRLRAERDRWRKIADDFYEAGSNLASHSEVAEDYEEARRD